MAAKTQDLMLPVVNQLVRDESNEKSYIEWYLLEPERPMWSCATYGAVIST